MKYLLLISLSFFFLNFCSIAKTANRTNEKVLSVTNHCADSIEKESYQIAISSKRLQVTGIFIVKLVGEEWRGTFINEFGIKAFDFVVTSKKRDLINVIPLLNKRFIKRILSSDIQQILLQVPNNEIEYINSRYKINYSLKKIYEVEK